MKELVCPVVADGSLAITERFEPGLGHGKTLSVDDRLAAPSSRRLALRPHECFRLLDRRSRTTASATTRPQLLGRTGQAGSQLRKNPSAWGPFNRFANLKIGETQTRVQGFPTRGTIVNRCAHRRLRSPHSDTQYSTTGCGSMPEISTRRLSAGTTRSTPAKRGSPTADGYNA